MQGIGNQFLASPTLTRNQDRRLRPRNGWKLSKNVPLSFNLDNSAFNMANLCWNQKRSQVCIEDTKTTADSGKSKLSIQNFDLANLNKFLPNTTRLTGRFAGFAKVGWKAKSFPTLDMNFSLAKGSVIQNVDDMYRQDQIVKAAQAMLAIAKTVLSFI